MATDRKMNINIGIKFDTQKEVSDKLKALIKTVEAKNNKIKLDIDTKNINKSFGQLSRTLNNINKQIKETFDFKKHLDKQVKDVQKATKEIDKVTKLPNKREPSTDFGSNKQLTSQAMQRRANAIKATMKELEKTTVVQNDKGNIEKAILSYTDNMGRVVKETMAWRNITTKGGKEVQSVFKTVGLQIVDNIAKTQKLNKAQDDLLNKRRSDLQSKLNSSKSNSLIDVNVLNDLQKKINSLNTDSSPNFFKNLKNDIDNLSSSDNGIVKLQSNISKLSLSIKKLQDNSGEFIPDKEFTDLITHVGKLQAMLNKLKSGGSFNGNDISRGIGEANQALRECVYYTQKEEKAMRELNREAGKLDKVTWGNSFKDMAQYAGIFNVMDRAVDAVTESFRQGMQAVIEMDKTMTTLSITMDNLTTTGLDNMGKEVQKMATELHATSSQVFEAVQTYANAKESVDSILNKTAPSIILSNLTGLDTQTTVNAIQSATMQFKDLSDGSAESSMKVVDSMTAISKALGMDYSKGIREMTDSISIMGSLAEQVGMDIDEMLGLIASSMEKTRLSGSEISNSFKTVISRTMRVKGDGVGEEEMLKAEKALDRYGVKIRNLSTGEMKDFLVIMKELNMVWGDLNQSEQMEIGDALGKENCPLVA